MDKKKIIKSLVIISIALVIIYIVYSKTEHFETGGCKLKSANLVLDSNNKYNLKTVMSNGRPETAIFSTKEEAMAQWNKMKSLNAAVFGTCNLVDSSPAFAVAVRPVENIAAAAHDAPIATIAPPPIPANIVSPIPPAVIEPPVIPAHSTNGIVHTPPVPVAAPAASKCMYKKMEHFKINGVHVVISTHYNDVKEFTYFASDKQYFAAIEFLKKSMKDCSIVDIQPPVNFKINLDCNVKASELHKTPKGYVLMTLNHDNTKSFMEFGTRQDALQFWDNRSNDDINYKFCKLDEVDLTKPNAQSKIVPVKINPNSLPSTCILEYAKVYQVLPSGKYTLEFKSKNKLLKPVKKVFNTLKDVEIEWEKMSKGLHELSTCKLVHVNQPTMEIYDAIMKVNEELNELNNKFLTQDKIKHSDESKLDLLLTSFAHQAKIISDQQATLNKAMLNHDAQKNNLSKLNMSDTEKLLGEKLEAAHKRLVKNDIRIKELEEKLKFSSEGVKNNKVVIDDIKSKILSKNAHSSTDKSVLKKISTTLKNARVNDTPPAVLYAPTTPVGILEVDKQTLAH